MTGVQNTGGDTVMIQLIKIQNTKANKNRNRYFTLKLGCLLITALLLVGYSIKTEAKAATGLKIYDYSTKSTSTYNGKQVKVTSNGYKIGNSNCPGILVDGVALLPSYDTFDKEPIDTDYVFNSKNNTISISKYNITILMTIGSTKALVNGKEVTLPVAPKKIKYIATNTIKVLVPSRFVSETLGMGYTWNRSSNTVAIVKHTLELSYNNGVKFEYSKTQGKVTIDGLNINLGRTPSIIIDDTAMLCAYKIFAASKIGAQYTYNKTDQTITINKNNNVLVMTVGSKSALLNNKTIVLPTAPIYVTNYETKTSYVMVPGEVTAKSLGFHYQWNNAKRTSMITTPASTNNSGDSGSDPELGDSGDISDTGIILNQWASDTTQYGSGKGVHNIAGTADALNTGTIYSVSRDYNDTKQNAETFIVASSTPFQKLTSNTSGKKITIQADNQICVDQSYQMYGTSSYFINTLSTYNNADGLSTKIELEVLPENYEYDIALSDNRQELYITIYLNTITSSIIGTNETGDYLILNGLKPLDTVITEAAGYIYIDLPNTANSLGYLNSEIQGSKYIKQFFIINMQDKTQLVLLLAEVYQYSTQKSDNEFTIVFQPKVIAPEPEPEPEPVVIDKSKYEIVIPKPENMTASMISDEDHYFNNYFNIVLKGDYTEYFNDQSITNKSKTVEKISVSLNGSGNTIIKIATSKLQGYEIATDDESICINVGNPRDIYKNIVLLDPGHGGDATGASKNGIREQDLNLKILYTVGKQYFNQDTSKLKVYYTRTTDVDMTLNDRAAFSKKVGADLFVSLHMNAVEQSYVEGTEVFYSKDNNVANDAGLTSQKFAAFFDTNLIEVLGTSDRGVKQAAFVVIKKNTVPAVLIELGFLTNAKDFAIITNEADQKIAAKTIYETLLQVFSKYPTGR